MVDTLCVGTYGKRPVLLEFVAHMHLHFLIHGMHGPTWGNACGFVGAPSLFVGREAFMDAKQRLAEGQVACGLIKAHGYELVVYKNPKVRCKPPLLVGFVTNCWFGESEILCRGGRGMLPRVLTGGGRCQPNGPPTPHHGATNYAGKRGLRLHLAVRGRERLCGMHDCWTRVTWNHHVGVPMGHYPSPLFR